MFLNGLICSLEVGYLLMPLTMLAYIEADNSECIVMMSNWLNELQLREESNWYREKSNFWLMHVMVHIFWQRIDLLSHNTPQFFYYCWAAEPISHDNQFLGKLVNEAVDAFVITFHTWGFPFGLLNVLRLESMDDLTPSNFPGSCFSCQSARDFWVEKKKSERDALEKKICFSLCWWSSCSMAGLDTVNLTCKINCFTRLLVVLKEK